MNDVCVMHEWGATANEVSEEVSEGLSWRTQREHKGVSTGFDSIPWFQSFVPERIGDAP
jgi:hypothetical protein